MVTHYILGLARTVLSIYALLLCLYFATAAVIERWNRRTSRPRLQSRVEPSSQMRRDRRQSVISLAGVAAMFGTGQWAYDTLGWGLRVNNPSSVIITVLSLAASLVLFDTWFYWLHRLIHHRALFSRVHRWHHRTVAPQVWSNNSDLLVDNLFLQSYWLVAHFLLPVAPIVLLAHKIYDQITGMIGHSGYERAGRICQPPSPFVSVTHHDQHHRYIRCNYATHFTWWDRLMGTLHPKHDEEVRRNLLAVTGERRQPARGEQVN
jgi:sterol desaturase/sphingolipid hydroxylase (fatty acid hydroxylase superfamily)